MTWPRLNPTGGAVEFSVSLSKQLVEKMGPFWTVRQVLSETGMPNMDALMAHVEGAQLLAVFAGDGLLMFPTWQFERVGHLAQVKPLLVPIFRTLRGHHPCAIAQILRTPNVTQLGGRTAVEVADAGDPDQMLREFACQVHRHWCTGAGRPQ